MTVSHAERDDTARTSDQRVHAHADFVVETLPGPDETWRRTELYPDDERYPWYHDLLDQFIYAGLIKVVDEIYQSGKYCNVYQLRREAYQTAVEQREARAESDEVTLPCDHSGISNLRGKDGFGCNFPGCDRRFVRDGDEFEEVSDDA